MFIAIFGSWVLAGAWFGPRLLGVLDAAEGIVSGVMLGYFVAFILIAWLYGLYNLGVIAFAAIDRRMSHPVYPPPLRSEGPAVAMLYTTCNDFDRASVESCLAQDYDQTRLYVLDDSSDPTAQAMIDAFVAAHPGRVTLVRREERRGFKAGNLNNGLAIADEPFFVTVDADEILPPDFVSMLVPRMLADPLCGFIQANHRCPDAEPGTLQGDMCRGVDIHWKWYQPLRNRFGFVMFLGHGAIMRRSVWEQVGGFPEIVSEDLAYAIAIREAGYYGTFAEDVVCVEQFPETVRAFRVRHVKWTRGTCEFLAKYAKRVSRSRRISLPEKLDILFPTLNLPLTLGFFVFMAITAIGLPLTIADASTVTVEAGGAEMRLPTLQLPSQFLPLYSWDFFLITSATILAPVLTFIIEMARTPIRLVRFLAQSTALYATLAPLSAIAVVGYLTTRQARFLVTGDTGRGSSSEAERSGVRARLYRFLAETHPDSRGVRGFEVVVGIALFFAALASLQVAMAGIAIGYLIAARMHTHGWMPRGLKRVSWLPAATIVAGFLGGGLGLTGVQAVMMGYGFHF